MIEPKPEYFESPLNLVQFFEDGTFIKNKYNKENLITYKMEGDSFYFVKNQLITMRYKIIKISNKIIQLESLNKEDTIKTIRKLTYVKTADFIKTEYDEVLTEISKLYDTGKPDTLGNGELLFNFNAEHRDPKTLEPIYDNPHQIEPKIKGIVDKTLNLLPKKEDKEKFSLVTGKMYCYYEWENPKLLLKMENEFVPEYDSSGKLNIRIWVIEK